MRVIKGKLYVLKPEDVNIWRVYEEWKVLPEFRALMNAADEQRALTMQEILDFKRELEEKSGFELTVDDALRIAVLLLARRTSYEEVTFRFGTKKFLKKELTLWFPSSRDSGFVVRPALWYNIALLARLAGEKSPVKLEGFKSVRAPVVDREKFEEAKNILRPYQREALERLASVGYYGSVQIPTGGGKTLIGSIVAAELKVPTVIVAPRIDILKQWKEHLKFVGFSEGDIGFLGGGKSEIGKPILLATYNSLYQKRSEVSGYMYKLLIADEAHRAQARTFILGVLSVPAVYRVGLSATFWRNEPANDFMAMRLMPLVYDIPQSLLIEQGALAKPKVVFVCTEMDEKTVESLKESFEEVLKSAEAKFLKKYESGGSITFSVYETKALKRRFESLINSVMTRTKNTVAKCRAKVDKAVELIEKHRDEKVIVFAEFRNLAKEIYKKVKSEGIPAWLFLDSRDVLEEFKRAKSGVLITAKKADEGINVPDANIGIIVSSRTTTQTRELIQRMGRVLRAAPGKKKATIYILVCRPTPVEIVELRRAVEAIAKELGEMEGGSVTLDERTYTPDELVQLFEKKLARSLCRDYSMAYNYYKALDDESIELAEVDCGDEVFKKDSCVREIL